MACSCRNIPMAFFMHQTRDFLKFEKKKDLCYIYEFFFFFCTNNGICLRRNRKTCCQVKVTARHRGYNPIPDGLYDNQIRELILLMLKQLWRSIDWAISIKENPMFNGPIQKLEYVSVSIRTLCVELLNAVL